MGRVEQWRQILWTDVSKFNLKGLDGKRNVRRSVGEQLKQVCTIVTVKHGGGKGLVVCGAFYNFLDSDHSIAQKI